MATEAEITNEFELLNIQLSGEVLKKCVEICANYSLEAEDFVNQWWAFAVSNTNSNGVPTLPYLTLLERKVLQKEAPKKTISTPKQTTYSENKEFEKNDGVSGLLANTGNAELITPNKNNRSIASKIQTPTTAKKLIDEVNSQLLSSPGSQAIKFSQRTDSKSVKLAYGPNSAQFRNLSSIPINIKTPEQHLAANARYMFEVMSKRRTSINNLTDMLGNAILDKYGLTLSDGYIKNSVGEMVTYGRIVSDSDGKINSQSLLLEGSMTTNFGHTVKLNVSKLSKYSLFPGQVVALKGNHISSQQVIAEHLYDDSSLEFNLEPPVTDETMQIVVAAGPFTTQDNLIFEPLTDLLNYVVEYKPHILLLIGPFLETTNDSVVNLGLMKTFDMFFEDLIANIMATLQDTDVQVIIVSSNKDAHHHPVYPTMPYNVRESYKNLTFVSDPCMVNINNLLIAATSVDVLMDISNFEISVDKNSSGQSDRLGRITSHLLKQKSFYPLFPTNSDVFVDYTLLVQHAMLDVKPHILILPSNLRHFIKDIEGCLVVNPERITKSYVGGTFARIEISPGSTHSISGRVACQVLKI